MARKKRVVKKAGDNVTIYYNPFNNRDIEGEATLISLIRKGKEVDYYWVVFLKDGFKCKRAIKHQYVVV